MQVKNKTRFCEPRSTCNTEHKKVQNYSKETGSKGIKKCCRRKLGLQAGVELTAHRQLESVRHQIWGSRDISQAYRAPTMKYFRLYSVSNMQTSQWQTSQANAKESISAQPTATSILFPTNRDGPRGVWKQRSFSGDRKSQCQKQQNKHGAPVPGATGRGEPVEPKHM